MAEAIDTRNGARERIVDAAAALLSEGGQAAVTTRAVAERAGVQAPAIYRLFGDKDGLLDAVTEHVMTGFATAKAAAVAGSGRVDPVEDLRLGWDMTIDFGLANPDLYVLLSDPARGQRSAATQAGIRLLAERVHRVALTGRLRVSEEDAVELIHAAGTGAILTILGRPAAQRDRRLADSMFDAVLHRILAAADAPRDATKANAIAPAVALRAHTEQVHALSPGERALLAEWLERIIEVERAAGR
ncbi:TetR/AcrR family transcriptional regulator [Actinospica sp. MGRD01-02]|uniref:TetR/AcrR family transcriptional regulator n=1 Tax=Actinospica acidithermotolerans TaxID=2828514 RepID=A0A941E603_9ACTN|nr:TetR/AcrR family transcriptional regulator [Actinospica acidithermotolerans]MBR7825721.1 TetR/AcrR family transcriptional regulator [Actinospica acidithermotolerans]